jgi:hypothetical protein
MRQYTGHSSQYRKYASYYGEHDAIPRSKKIISPSGRRAGVFIKKLCFR